MIEQNKRPNIVFLFADDWGRYASAYAKFEGENSINQIISTPNFDRVANEGAIFTNAHAPAPSCTPCRSSILTGTYFWETGLGAILEGARWDESIPTYPLMLEKVDTTSVIRTKFGLLVKRKMPLTVDLAQSTSQQGTIGEYFLKKQPRMLLQ